MSVTIARVVYCLVLVLSGWFGSSIYGRQEEIRNNKYGYSAKTCSRLGLCYCRYLLYIWGALTASTVFYHAFRHLENGFFIAVIAINFIVVALAGTWRYYYADALNSLADYKGSVTKNLKMMAMTWKSVVAIYATVGIYHLYLWFA